MEPVVSAENQIEGQAKNESDANSPVVIDGSLAYAAQQAWIQNATLKDNILFRYAMAKFMVKNCLLIKVKIVKRVVTQLFIFIANS